MDRAAYLPPVHHSYLPDELRSPAAAKMALSNLSGQIGTLRDPGGHFGHQNKPKATMTDIYFTGTGDEAADRKIRRDLAAGQLQRVKQGVYKEPGKTTSTWDRKNIEKEQRE